MRLDLDTQKHILRVGGKRVQNNLKYSNIDWSMLVDVENDSSVQTELSILETVSQESQNDLYIDIKKFLYGVC